MKRLEKFFDILGEIIAVLMVVIYIVALANAQVGFLSSVPVVEKNHKHCHTLRLAVACRRGRFGSNVQTQHCFQNYFLRLPCRYRYFPVFPGNVRKPHGTYQLTKHMRKKLPLIGKFFCCKKCVLTN